MRSINGNGLPSSVSSSLTTSTSSSVTSGLTIKVGGKPVPPPTIPKTYASPVSSPYRLASLDRLAHRQRLFDGTGLPGATSTPLNHTTTTILNVTNDKVLNVTNDKVLNSESAIPTTQKSTVNGTSISVSSTIKAALNGNGIVSDVRDGSGSEKGIVDPSPVRCLWIYIYFLYCQRIK